MCKQISSCSSSALRCMSCENAYDDDIGLALAAMRNLILSREILTDVKSVTHMSLDVYMAKNYSKSSTKWVLDMTPHESENGWKQADYSSVIVRCYFVFFAPPNQQNEMTKNQEFNVFGEAHGEFVPRRSSSHGWSVGPRNGVMCAF